MGFSDVFTVVKELLFDWRVLAAFIVVLLYLNFVFYVSKYRKKQNYKPKRIVKQNDAASAAQTSGESSQSSESSDDDDQLV